MKNKKQLFVMDTRIAFHLRTKADFQLIKKAFKFDPLICLLNILVQNLHIARTKPYFCRQLDI